MALILLHFCRSPGRPQLVLAVMQILLTTGANVAYSGSAACMTPGKSCPEPEGGVCTAGDGKLACQCPASQTFVQKQQGGGKTCKTKLLDIPCSRDSDSACQMVKSSVCTLYDAICVCDANSVYVPHRHECKPKYSGLSGLQYCKICRDEGGVCFKEEDPRESVGPLVTEGGATFRLSCACSENRGVPRMSDGALDNWSEPVCRTKLRDIDDVCDERTLICRSKRALCRKPRDMETDFKKCQCRDGHVPVYQPWLKYYECFEKLSSSAEQCRTCWDSMGICYAPSNSSSPGCHCPKRLSTPPGKGAKPCSKHHVLLTCHDDRMEVTFDPNYASAPYSLLPERLKSGESIAYIEVFSDDGSTTASFTADGSVCRLEESPGGLYKATLRLDSADSVCGRRAVRVERMQTDTADERTHRAVLRVLWNRDFYTYPDIVVDLLCKVSVDGPSRGPEIKAKKPDPLSPILWKPPKTVSGISLWLRVINQSGDSVPEIEEGETIRLDLMLYDPAGSYTSLLVKQCSVASQSAAALRQDKAGVTKIIGCGGSEEADSGFRSSFLVTRSSFQATHLQTGRFAAFRLGKLPTLFFACTVRICKESEAAFCDAKTVCRADKMAKRSPDSGVQEVDQEVRLVVAPKHVARRSEINVSGATCQHSMCLSTSQVIVIIMILLVLLALLTGLVVVFYRRRLMLTSARRIRLATGSGGGLDDDTTPMQTPIDTIGKAPQHGHATTAGGVGVFTAGHHCTTLPRISVYGGPHVTHIDTLDSGLGASMRAYASIPLDRGDRGSAMKCRHPAAQMAASACLLDRPPVCGNNNNNNNSHITGGHSSRPDVCTCDRSVHSTYSITSSQV